jgi:hypothetical protein
MKLLLAFAVVLAVGAGVYAVFDPLSDDSDSSAGAKASASEPLTGSACQRLAGLAANLAAQDRTAEQFLIDLGKQGAGIRANRFALLDLARDGRNIIVGRGFKPPFDDGTRGQVRHFVGVARASMFGGSTVTRWLSENLRNDPADSPDGRLADQGIDFAQSLLAGRLELNEASGWIRQRLCKP